MKTLLSLSYYTLLGMLVFIFQISQSRNPTFFARSNDIVETDTSGSSIIAAQWLAIQEINNNSGLLPNYTVDLKVFDSNGDAQHSLVQALEITNLYASAQKIACIFQLFLVLHGHQFNIYCTNS